MHSERVPQQQYRGIFLLTDKLFPRKKRSMRERFAGNEHSMRENQGTEGWPSANVGAGPVPARTANVVGHASQRDSRYIKKSWLREGFPQIVINDI